MRWLNQGASHRESQQLHFLGAREENCFVLINFKLDYLLCVSAPMHAGAGLSLGLGLTHWARLADQQSPGTFLPRLPTLSRTNACPRSQLFTRVLQPTSVLGLCRKHLLSGPCPSLFNLVLTPVVRWSRLPHLLSTALLCISQIPHVKTQP